MRFADPWLLLLLILPGLGLLWLFRKRATLHPGMRYSSLKRILQTPRTLRSRLIVVPNIILLLVSVLLMIALARPQSAVNKRKQFAEGIAIMLVLDVSVSMLAKDFEPNRLEKSKEVVNDFISGRENDQIGVVIFGKDTFYLCPLTQDYHALNRFVDRIDFDLVDGFATAIGMGLANAVKRLKESKAKSKVAILLTDGENNTGQIDPISAAKIARDFNVRVYTIGVGTADGWVLGPRFFPDPDSDQLQLAGYDRIRSTLDVGQLTEIAELTRGQFFHAKDGASLKKIYEQIDQMERTKIEVSETHYFDELGHYLMLPAVLLLIVGIVLENTWLRTFP
jgi:Ca-activated chloride channel family protein